MEKVGNFDYNVENNFNNGNNRSNKAMYFKNKKIVKNLVLLTCGVTCIFLVGWVVGSYFTSGGSKKQPVLNKNNDYYNGYNTNAILSYDNVNILVVNRDNIESIKEALNKGFINYNGELIEFEVNNSNKSCSNVIYGSVLHYAKYDNKVLFKSKNCIPDNQHITKIKE